MIFIELLLQRKLSFIGVYTYVINFNLAGFLAYVQKFSRLLDKFEVSLSCEALCVIFLNGFSVWFFKTEFNPLQDLLNTGFTIIEIDLFYGNNENLEAKICRFQFFFSRTTCENTSNTCWVFLTFIKTINLLPKGLLLNAKTMLFVKFLLRFVKCFALCSCKLSTSP